MAKLTIPVKVDALEVAKEHAKEYYSKGYQQGRLDAINECIEITKNNVRMVAIDNLEELKNKTCKKQISEQQDDNKNCSICEYYSKAPDAPDTVEKDCIWIPSEDESVIPCERIYNEQIINLEVTYIKDIKTLEQIKELLNADKVDVISEQIFEHERDMLSGDYMDEKG